MPGIQPERFKPLSTIRESQEYTPTTTRRLYGFEGDQAGSGSNESSHERTSTTGSNAYYGINLSKDVDQRLSDWTRAHEKLTGSTGFGDYEYDFRKPILDNSPSIDHKKSRKWEKDGAMRTFNDYAEKRNLTTKNAEKVLKAEHEEIITRIKQGLLGPKERYDDWQVKPDLSSYREDRW